MKIYTKRGDDGKTNLLGSSSRVSKASPRVSTFGGIDELNSMLGLAESENRSSKTRQTLRRIQRELFSIGAELATPTKSTARNIRTHRFQRISFDDVKRLELDIDKVEKKLRPLTNFILPGGTKMSSLLHVARSTCRRIEREVVDLGEEVTLNPAIGAYLNRLSDLLFVLARESNYRAGIRENEWVP